MGGTDVPACITSNDFDCSTCEFLDPRSCDLRRDFAFLEVRRRWLAPTMLRAPRPGLEALAYTALCGRGTAHYRDLAAQLSSLRGAVVNPVALLEVLKRARDPFLDLGAGRFHAVSTATAFDTPTENLWLRLPPYKEVTKEVVGKQVRRIALTRYVQRLQADATLSDLLALVGHWQSFPTDAQIKAAEDRPYDDLLAARAAIDYVAQLARVSPRPPLSMPIDVGSIKRAGAAAAERLVEGNLRLVADTARGFAARGVEYFDLCQIGVVGLIRAIEKFNPDLGFQFSTYATWWLRQAMSRSVQDEGRAIRIPVHMYEKAPWLQKEHAPHSIPADTPAALRPMLSLDTLDERWMPAATDDWMSRSDDAVQYSAVHTALDELTGREREVLVKRFGLDGGSRRTLEVIGVHFGVTRERIRQIEAKAFRRLRHPGRKLHRLLPEIREPANGEPLRPYQAVTPLEWRVLRLRYGLDGRPPRSLAECAAELKIDPARVHYLERTALNSMDAHLAAMLRAHKWSHPMPNVSLWAATYLPKPNDRAGTGKAVSRKTVAERPEAPPVNEPARADGHLISGPPENGADANTPPTLDEGAQVSAEDAPVDMSREPRTLPEAMKERLTSGEALVLTRRLGLDGKRRLSIREIAYLYRYQEARVRLLQDAAVEKLGSRFGALVRKQLAEDDG